VKLSGETSLTSDLAVIYLAYKPDIDDLRYVRQLSSTVNVVVISNSGGHDFGSDVAATHVFGENVGVGAGYNAGLELAKAAGFRNVLFHDQDSRIDIEQLKAGCRLLHDLNRKFSESAVVSLNPVDIETGESRKPRVTFPTAEGSLLRYRDVQFSGLLAPISVFENTPFSDYLFVDNVDSEWCWRTASTVRILRDPAITIGHRLGSGTQTKLGFGYSLPNPSRHFYQVRNLVVLTKYAHVPLKWKVSTTCKYTLRAVALPFVDRRFLSCWRHSIRGVRSGLADRKLNPLTMSIGNPSAESDSPPDGRAAKPRPTATSQPSTIT
jgi:rhamnosyltransferase